MDISSTKENKTSRIKEGTARFLRVLKKIIIGILLAAAVAFALVVIYQVIRVLFALVILAIAFCCPKRRW